MTKYNTSVTEPSPLRQQRVSVRRNCITLIVLFLFTTIFSLKLQAQDPGRGGTRAGFEVDADFKSGFIPAFWNTNIYTNYPMLGDDWSKGTTGNAVLKQL